jgi:hypothetical protein
MESESTENIVGFLFEELKKNTVRIESLEESNLALNLELRDREHDISFLKKSNNFWLLSCSSLLIYIVFNEIYI